MPATLTIDGRDYIVVPREDFERLTGAKAPKLPRADKQGRRPARSALRATFAQSLIRRRIAAGLTQKQIAEQAGIATETLSRIETGKHRPQAATVEKIAGALGE